jgi:hypothetical protein
MTDTTILTVTMMETSPENVDFHMLFVYIYFSNHWNSWTTFLCHNFPPSLSNKPFIMFLPSTSILDPVIYPFADKFYPPPILIKYHIWFLPVTDLFISLNGILYSVHQSHFEQSPLFQEVLQYGRDKESFPMLSTLWKRKSSTIFFIYYTLEPNDLSILTEKNGAISNN